MPNMGRLLINKGNNAQCMAQASEVAIPTKSKFIFIDINKEQIYIIATMLQNNS